jgi:uncharacterized membrane protein YbhN (UPF0104 family)
MTDRTKAIAKLLARLLVTTVLLWYAFRQVDLHELGQVARSARWSYLIGAWLFVAAFFLIQSLAMQLILRRQGCDVKVPTLFAASSVTVLYGLILPGILSTGIKWFILKKHTGKGTNVLSSMLYNQVMLSAAMSVVGLAALILTNPTRVLLPGVQEQWILPAVCIVLLALVVSVCVLLLNARTGGVVTPVLVALLKVFPRAVRERGQKVLSQLALFQTAGVRFHLTIAVVNVFDGLVVGLLIYFCAARAVQVMVGLGVLVWLWAAVYLLSKVPISVANLGVREVTLVGLLAAYGIDKPSALAMSMALFTGVLFMAALGAVFQLVWAAQARSAPATSESEQPPA